MHRMIYILLLLDHYIFNLFSILKVVECILQQSYMAIRLSKSILDKRQETDQPILWKINPGLIFALERRNCY